VAAIAHLDLPLALVVLQEGAQVGAFRQRRVRRLQWMIAESAAAFRLWSASTLICEWTFSDRAQWRSGNRCAMKCKDTCTSTCMQGEGAAPLRHGARCHHTVTRKHPPLC